jgi:hypothetical protein
LPSHELSIAEVDGVSLQIAGHGTIDDNGDAARLSEPIASIGQCEIKEHGNSGMLRSVGRDANHYITREPPLGVPPPDFVHSGLRELDDISNVVRNGRRVRTPSLGYGGGPLRTAGEHGDWERAVALLADNAFCDKP